MSKINRKAIITGGSKGIGKAIAERFAKESIDIKLSLNILENKIIALWDTLYRAQNKNVNI